MAQEVTWKGAKGEYKYWVHSLDKHWKDESGNYIFAKVVDDKWHPIYIGETESLKDRLGPQHHKWTCGQRNGMTHIHAHTTPSGEKVRKAEETDLLANRNPPCND